jgi:hypothetical protein
MENRQKGLLQGTIFAVAVAALVTIATSTPKTSVPVWGKHFEQR